MTQQELLALLASATTPAVPTQDAGTPVQGPIVVLPSGDAKIGDCRLNGVPAGIQWVKATGTVSKTEYLQSPTIWAATGHLGRHGSAWADNLQDTGTPVQERRGLQRVDFAALMKAASEPTSDAPAEEPAI